MQCFRWLEAIIRNAQVEGSSPLRGSGFQRLLKIIYTLFIFSGKKKGESTPAFSFTKPKPNIMNLRCA